MVGYQVRWAYYASLTEDGRLLCRDRWESVGPGRGMYARVSGGLIDTSCYLIDKRRVVVPLVGWTMVTAEDGAGQDRQMMQALTRHHTVAWTGRHSVAYALRPGSRLWRRIRLQRRAERVQIHRRLLLPGQSTPISRAKAAMTAT